VADVIVSKLVDHLPLYRQEKRYARQGFSLARSTLCGWLAEAAHVLTPLWRLLRERVLASNIVNTDDTPVPVQVLSPVENGGASRGKTRVKMAAHMRAVR
jgi:hypothetical protein